MSGQRPVGSSKVPHLFRPDVIYCSPGRSLTRVGPADGSAVPSRSLAMDTTSPARLARRKRLSHEDEQDEYMPTPATTAKYLATQKWPLVATFVVAWCWFARVVAPLAASTISPAPAAGLMAAPQLDFGLYLATGFPGITHLSSAAAPAQPHSPRPLAPSPPAATTRGPSTFCDDLGYALAMGSPALFRRDASTAVAAAPPTALAAPKTRPSAASADVSAFVLTCALVHTLLVAFGLAFGSDSHVLDAGRGRERSRAHAMLSTGCACFGLLCLALYLSWEYQLGPVPGFASRIFAQSEAAFVLVGGLSATGWVATSMLLEATHLGAARDRTASRVQPCGSTSGAAAAR